MPQVGLTELFSSEPGSKQQAREENRRNSSDNGMEGMKIQKKRTAKGLCVLRKRDSS